MVKLGLKPLKRNKRKYSSYKGTVGKIADNLIERNFSADNPNEKWYTDVTEFNLRGEKIYLSPILDGFNGEVISYNTSKFPNLEQINDMLKLNDKKKFEYTASIILNCDMYMNGTFASNPASVIYFFCRQ